MRHLTNRAGRTGRALRTLLVIAVTATVVAPVAAFASNQFSDVPDGHTFHDDITWLADNGVTKGCNPPDNSRFCPGDAVTREQMAAFMGRLATNQVVDAGTLDGLDSGAFARSDQACGAGDVVTGVAADGTVTCAADNADGGDADTLDGMDASDLGFLDSYRDSDLEVGTTHTNSSDGGNPFEELVTRAVDVPTDGFLLVTSNVFIAEADGTNQVLASVTRLDWDPDVPLADQRDNLIGVDLHSPGGSEEAVGASFTTAAGIAVSAGTHTVTLHTQGADADTPYTTAGPRLTTVFVPFGTETLVDSSSS